MDTRYHICVEHHSGWWYGKCYTSDPATGREIVLYTTPAYAKKLDCAEAIYNWYGSREGRDRRTRHERENP